MKKATQSRPTREEILEGIGYTPLTFPENLHVPEAVRAAEDLAMQDYIVGWTLGLWDHINKAPAQSPLVLPQLRNWLCIPGRRHCTRPWLPHSNSARL